MAVRPEEFDFFRTRIFLQKLTKEVPALKGEVDSKTLVFEDGGVFLA